MKRAVSLFLSLLLALSLSACGGGEAVYLLETSQLPESPVESAEPSPDLTPPTEQVEAIFQAPSPDVSLSAAPQTLPEESAPAPETEPSPMPEPSPSPEPEPSSAPEESDPSPSEEEEPQPVADGTDYVLNTNTKKFHIPTCSSVDTIKPKNRQDYTGTRDEVIAMGFDPCGRCHP